MLVHVRKASPGYTVEPLNNHPFYAIHAGIPVVFAHNGTLLEPVLDMIPDKVKQRSRGSTDSEQFFHYLLETRHGSPLTPEAVKQLIDTLPPDGYSGLNLVVATPEWAIVNVLFNSLVNDRTKYFTMKRLQVKDGVLITSERIRISGYQSSDWVELASPYFEINMF